MSFTPGKKVRALAIGVMTATALAVPAITSLSASTHAVGKAPVVQPASHRLALSVNPASLRLT